MKRKKLYVLIEEEKWYLHRDRRGFVSLSRGGQKFTEHMDAETKASLVKGSREWDNEMYILLVSVFNSTKKWVLEQKKQSAIAKAS